MTSLKRDRQWVVITVAFIVAICMFPLLAFASQPCAVSPAAGGVSVLPNVLVIFDNSGSMTEYAHQDSYDPTATYTGIFNTGERYNYVGSASSNPNSGYFEQAATGGSWSGNFLNWACMQRIDVARKIMTGGKVTTDGGNTYITANNYTYYGTYGITEPTHTYTDSGTPSQTPNAGSDSYVRLAWPF